VLVIEDEDTLLEALRYNLSNEGYQVSVAPEGNEGLALARELQPDLVILDVMLPGLDGFQLCRILRGESDVPIMMLTARVEEIDRVVGLELGADDYVVKPFSMREFLARVRGMLRRSRQAADGTNRGSVSAGDLELDLNSHTVRRAGAPLELKPREYALLSLMMTNTGKAYTRHEILDRVWGQDYIGDTRTVDVHIRWLREKIEPDPGNPQRLITIRGVGYRFQG
jgi:DNA-binding response OmpR family regulator